MPQTTPTSPVDSAAVKAALRVVIPYVIFAGLWVFLSDKILIYFAPSIERYSAISILKGAFFVVASGAMLFLLMRNTLQARHKLDSERLDLLNREQAARAKAESASRAKDELLAMVSHELRTPLTAILTSAEVLEQDHTLSDENHELAGMIRENVLQESRIVGDLLDCSSLASGKLELRRGRADLHHLIHSAMADLRIEAAAKQLDMRLDLQADPPLVNGDAVRLSQVLRNLLVNAIKFTPDAGTITVRTARQDASVSVEVNDTGIGMSAEIRNRLFRPFEQGDKSITRRFGGLGLGLYLSSAIVEMHGGKLSAASPGEGKGSTFRFEVPNWVDHAPKGPTAMPEESKCQGMSVLLVEDNIDTLRVLGRLLGRLGCTVMAARSGSEAIELARREHVDLIVSDIGLPDQSGWEVIRQIRETQPIHGIAISGFDSEEDRQRSKEAGFEAHLVKPVSFPSLQSAIIDLASRRARDVAQASSPA